MAESSVLEKLDFGALSFEQQERLRQFKNATKDILKNVSRTMVIPIHFSTQTNASEWIKTRISNEKYLRSHPEVDLLLSDFLREVFLKRPTDIREFAAEHFSDPGLQKKIETQMNIHI